MQRYHLYYLRDGKVVGSDDIDASDDQEAGEIAAARGNGRGVEIWNAYQRVRVIAPLQAMPVAH